MKSTRSNFFAVSKPLVLLVGFVAGLLAGADDSNSLTVVEGIIVGPISILILPPLTVLFFRLEVAVGVFKPPWEAPSRAHEMNPLTFVQLGSFVCAVMGIGAMISIVWNGATAIGTAFLMLSEAIALHIALVWLMKIFPPPETDTQELLK